MRGNFRGGAGFARPENALKRADELENVGQKQSALQALHDIVTSKKHRTWSKTYESIMFKLVDLCVEMKKRNQAKEALMQYRNMCQQVNINSLEEVIKYYLNKATEKAEEAQAKAEATVSQASTALATVEDLEEDASPEDLMLSYVSGEKSKDRTDRELVTPWFRFLWESYRSVLEILRTNPKLEALYAMTANRAFQFCQHYKRTAEFRRLCDILRQHLANINKYRDQRDITQPESMNLHLETRFEQLKVACELEMWAEAFRTVEDIQALITLAKRQPKQQMMATYYSRLTQIFAVSESHLYHAYAWLKLFNFSRSYNKNLTGSDQSMMATSVVLATLSILPYERSLFNRQDEQTSEQEKERTIRMAAILGFTVDSKRVDYRSILTRQALLSSITTQNILALVPREVRAVYELLTSDFNPLELCAKLAPLMADVANVASPMSAASPVKDLNMGLYVNSLKQVAIVRLLKQLSEVYSTMKISELAALVPFATFSDVESIVVDAVKYDYLQLHIDHRNGTLHFGSQQLESEKIRNHLQLLAKRLAKVASMTAPAAPPAPALSEHALAAVRHCKEHIEGEHKRAVLRKALIEKRKEQQEALLLEQEKEEERKRVQMAREQEALEERRRREEAARREKDRLEKEIEEQEMAEARALLEASKKKKGGTAALKDGDKLDKKALMQEALSERIKEQQELERKLQRTARQLDHLERARREEEVPYLQEAYAKRQEEDRALHEEQQRQFLEAHRAAWELDIVEKRRLSEKVPDKEAFAALIISRRQEEFEALKRAREARAKERRAQRKVEREIARRKEFVKRCRAAVQERIEEMEAAAKAAEEERRKAELAERQRKLEETMAKQRAREEEIERRMREEKERALGRAPPAAAAAAPEPVAARPPSAGGAAPNKFVPPALRAKMMAAAAAGGGGGAAPAAADPSPREREAESWRDSRAAPAAAPAAVPAAAREDGDRWGSRAADASAPAPAREPTRSSGGGAYRPPVRAGSDAPPARRPEDGPAAARGAENGSADAAPPPASSGGAYRPPSKRW